MKQKSAIDIDIIVKFFLSCDLILGKLLHKEHPEVQYINNWRFIPNPKIKKNKKMYIYVIYVYIFSNIISLHNVDWEESTMIE